jgi:hypothetical protein
MPTEHKQEKYCQTIRNRNLNAKHTLNETKLHGKPLHATRITPKERAHITDLKHLTATQRDKPHVLLNSPKGTDFELNRWLHALSSPPSSEWQGFTYPPGYGPRVLEGRGKGTTF